MSTQTVCPDCGWKSKPTTPAFAAKALRTHSCALQRERDASRARGDAIRAAVAERTVSRPCLHKQARHEHGTYVAYVLDRCRCDDCRAAHRVYVSHRARRQGYGLWQPYVDAQPTRDHLTMLMASGLGWKRIAGLAGVAQSIVSSLIYGKRRADGEVRPIRKVRPETEKAILRVRATLDVIGAGATVDATGTKRRLQALVAAGWSRTRLGERLGRGPTNFGRIFAAERVTAATARAVRDLYDELWDVAPPQDTHWQRGAVNRARSEAARLGWALPMAWDDDTIDDPDSQPDPGDRRPAGVQVEDVEWLLRTGVHGEALAKRLGVVLDSVETACRRGGRTDLIPALKRGWDNQQEAS